MKSEVGGARGVVVVLECYDKRERNLADKSLSSVDREKKSSIGNETCSYEWGFLCIMLAPDSQIVILGTDAVRPS